MGQPEPVYDGLVDDLLGGEHEQHVRIGYDVLCVLVLRQLVGILDDGVHRPVLLPDLLIAEGHGAVYPGSRGRIDHLRGLAVLVKDQDAPFPPVTEQLLLYDGEYHAHHEVAQKPVLLDLRQFEHDELLSREVRSRILAYVLVASAGQELAAVQAEGLQGEIIFGDVLPCQNLGVMFRHVVVETLEIVPFTDILVIILDETGEGHLLLRLVLCEHVPPVFLHDPREHLDASVVQFFPLQVEGVDAQRRPAVVVHVQGDVRIEPAELAEALSELDHHDRIVLLDELLGEVQGKGGLAAAGSGYDHPVTGVDPLLARIPDVLSQRDLVHPVMHIDALAVIPETAALEKEAQCHGQGGQEQVFPRHQVDLAGDAGEMHRRQVLISGNIIPEAGQVERLPDLFVGLLQFGPRLVEHTDREEAAYQCLVLLKDFLLELVQFLVLYLDGPAHAGIASINVDIAGDPFAQPSVPLKENHLVHDVVVRQVHPKLLQHRMVQQGAGGRKGVVPYTGIQAAVREKGLIADGEAACPFLSCAEFRVGMYVHNRPRSVEQGGVSGREVPHFRSGHRGYLRITHALDDADGVVNSLEEFIEPGKVLLMEVLLIGQGRGYVGLLKTFESGKYKVHDAGMADIQSSPEMPRIGPVKERTAGNVRTVPFLEEHILFVHICTVREKLEGFPEHAVPPVDILRSQGIAFRFPEFERNAYAAAAGQDDALSLRFTDNVKYAVCLF